MNPLKKLVLKGAIWTILGYGSSQLLRFGSNLLLTRLLVPEFFGLMALANIFILGLALFSDVGVGVSIVQSKRGDEPDFVKTAWTIKVIRGIGIWLGCVLLGYPVAQLYNEPILAWLIPVAGLSIVMDGFSSATLLSLERHMAIRTLTLLDLSRQVIQISVMLVLAWLSPSVWALVIGGLVADLFRLGLSYRLTPQQVSGFCWDKTAVKEILGIGQWIFLATALSFSAEQIDRLLLGKLFSLEMLGIYTVALTLSEVPRQATIALSMKVIFPAISKLTNLPRPELRSKLLRSRRPLLLVLALGMAVMIGLGDLAISILYDARYAAAAWMFPILTLGLWPRVISTTIEPALTALGKVQYAATGNLLRLLFTIAGILVGYYLLRELGAIIAVALNDVLYYAVMNYGGRREGLGGSWQDVQATGVLLIATGMIVMIRLSIGLGTPLQGLVTL